MYAILALLVTAACVVAACTTQSAPSTTMKCTVVADCNQPPPPDSPPPETCQICMSPFNKYVCLAGECVCACDVPDAGTDAPADALTD